MPLQWPEVDLLDDRVAFDDRSQAEHRMAPMKLVGPEADDQADGQLAADAQHRLHELARARIGVVEILERKHDDTIAGQPGEHPDDRLQEPAGLLVGRRTHRVVRDQPEVTDAFGDRWHELSGLQAGRSDDVREPLVVERLEAGAEGRAERRVRHALLRLVGRRAQDDHVGQVRETRLELGQQPADADAGGSSEGDPRRLARCRALQPGRQAGELAFSTDEGHRSKDTRRVSHTASVIETPRTAAIEPTEPVAPAGPHPDNDLNELTGEAWLYFTKSLWTTAYPSELGHAARKAHGANKPPRLMARLIEFFTVRDELVLDPFAGVGGTLLGAAICRAPRRALGFELEPRWAAIYAEVVAAALADRDGAGPRLADLGSADPGGPRAFDPSGCEMACGDAMDRLADLADGSIDFVATDPPYNPQLRLTMAGGRLAETHANRRTDYAMVTDSDADLANSASYPEYLDRMEAVFAQLQRVLRPGRYATFIVRDAYQDGRYRFTAADLTQRAERVGLVPKGDLIWYQAGTRLRPYGYPRAFVPNIVHQHIVVLRRP